MAKKSFRVPRADRPPQAFDLVFEVRAQEKVNVGTDEAPDWQERDIEPARWVEEVREFHAQMNIPGRLVVDTTPAAEGDMDGARRQGVAIRTLLRTAVVEADEFDALLDDPRVVVPMATLVDVMNWAVEESGEVPTNGPRRS